MHGPAKSPIILETPKDDSVNAEAHCNMDISEAPEQSINSINNQNNGKRNNSTTCIPSPSSTSLFIGQEMKLNVLYSGSSAHINVRICQCFIPKIAKNIVEPSMTPTVPQQ